MRVLTVRRRGRQWLLFAHVVLSIGWLGAGAANVVLAVTAARTTDGEIQRACYRLIHVLDLALVIPLAFGALASGVLISLATKWGLWRYWWVIVKFALTVAVIVFSTFGVGAWVEQSIASTSIRGTESPVALQLILGALTNLAAFLFMTWASIAKPWPKTRWFKTPRAATLPGQ